MISMYKWQRVKVLQSQGKGIKEIARCVKLSRNTVRKYMRSAEPPRFKKREYKRILNGFESEIMEMLSKGYIGTRIYDEDRCRIRTGYGPENIIRLRRFAIGVIKSKGMRNVAQKMRELTRNVRLVFDYLRMTKNSCASASKI